MYCRKLLNIASNKDSDKYLIDKLIIYKLDEYLKHHVTLRERQNINPVKFAIEMKIEHLTAIMTFIIGSRVGLFKIRLFFECECGEKKELETTNEIIECECGITGNYESLKESIKLYFFLLEKPSACDWNIEYKNDADLLVVSDLMAIVRRAGRARREGSVENVDGSD